MSANKSCKNCLFIFTSASNSATLHPMTRFWENRKPANVQNSRMVHLYRNGVFHAMACDGEGNIALHIIEENEDPDCAFKMATETGAINNGGLLLENPFLLVPDVFEKSYMTGLPAGSQTNSYLDKGIRLQVGNSPDYPAFHAVIPLYHIAKKNAEHFENYVYSCILYGHCIVLFFKNGKCELANIFPAKNDSEVLYFAVAPVKKAGLNVQQVRFEFLADAEESRNILKTADRFLPNAGLARLDLPYPAGEYPPFAAVAFLLYQYLQCELPEAV